MSQYTSYDSQDLRLKQRHRLETYQSLSNNPQGLNMLYQAGKGSPYSLYPSSFYTQPIIVSLVIQEREGGLIVSS